MNTDMTTGAVAGMQSGSAAKHVAGQEKAALKEACREFEGILLGIIMKDGLKTEALAADEEDASYGGEMFKEYASEQVARSLGQDESFGIARMMYEQLSGERRHAR